MKAVLAALAASAILGGIAAMSLIAPGGDDTSAGAAVGPYPGVVLEPPADPATPRASSAMTPPASTPAPTVLAPTATPSPVILGAQSTPAPTSQPTAAPMSEAIAQDRCPRLPILISPSAELAAATESAIAMWERHLGCDAFIMTSGGIVVMYEPGWPGVCEDTDIAACSYNGIFLSPLVPRYDPASVIAHELGHVLNFGHDDGPTVMSPATWSGPSTVFCEIATRCR